MSDKHRSIGERLARAKSPEAIQAVLDAWVANWADDQMGIVEQLEFAARTGDRDTLISAIGQMRATTEKRMIGLRGVLHRLVNK